MLKRIARSTKRAGLWTLAPGQLQVDWAGAIVELAGNGEASCVVRIPAEAMHALARVSPAGSDVRVEVVDSRVSFNGFIVNYERLAAPAQVLAPIHATQLQVLVASYRQTAEEIDASGLGRSIAEAEARRDRCIEVAAERLAWLGIDAALLATWVDAHLNAVATRDASAAGG